MWKNEKFALAEIISSDQRFNVAFTNFLSKKSDSFLLPIKCKICMSLLSRFSMKIPWNELFSNQFLCQLISRNIFHVRVNFCSFRIFSTKHFCGKYGNLTSQVFGKNCVKPCFYSRNCYTDELTKYSFHESKFLVFPHSVNGTFPKM